MTGIKPLKIDLSLRNLSRVALVALLLSPYLVWLSAIEKWSWPGAGTLLSTIATAIVQSSLSALLSLLVGAVIFLGLSAWPEGRSRKFAEALLLLPNMVPPLVLSLALLNLVTPWMRFPYGLGAVIFAHVLLNSGLVAVALHRLVAGKVGGMAETSWILGASRFEFLSKVAWPLMRADLACLFMFVFAICFTSFSLPLLLGGQSAATLEVTIYDLIRVEGRWDQAVILAAVQSFGLLLLARLLPQSFWPGRPARTNLAYLSWRGGRYLLGLPFAILFLGWSIGFSMGMRSFSLIQPSVFLEAALTTLSIGVGVGVLHLILFLWMAYLSPHANLRRFLNGFLSPSAVIAGFAMLLIPGESENFRIGKLILALTLISVPLLYRWTVHSALIALDEQVRVARTLGATWFAILSEIVWPQTSRQILRAAGLAAVWACGDFAMTGIVGGSLVTLPSLMEDLIGGYRTEEAQVLMLPLFAIGLFIYFGFNQAGRYVRR